MSEAQHHPTTDRRFSQDIIELIFEEAQLDDFHKTTLFACSRVSNEWRRIALKYVFRTLSLIVQSNEEIRFPIHINRFMTDFLAAPESSYLAPLVRKLTITWGTLAGNPIQYDFIDYLPSFPSLHTLSLVGGVAQRITETARPYVGTLCLDNLWIEGQPSNFHDLVALCDLLSLFRSLNCLRLDRVKTLRRTIDRAGWQQIPLPKISSLALRNMDALDRDCVLSKLLGPRSVLSTLKSLDVTATTLLAAGFKTLGRHASSVEHLALEVQIPSSRPSDLQRVIGPEEMSSYTSLRSLEMIVCLECQDSLLSRAAAMISALLSSVQLTFIDLRLCGGFCATNGAERPATQARKNLAAAHSRIGELDTVLVKMVQEQRLKFLRAGLYSTDADMMTDPATELLFYHPSSQRIQQAFPRLHAMEALRV